MAARVLSAESSVLLIEVAVWNLISGCDYLFDYCFADSHLQPSILVFVVLLQLYLVRSKADRQGCRNGTKATVTAPGCQTAAMSAKAVIIVCVRGTVKQ